MDTLRHIGKCIRFYLESQASFSTFFHENIVCFFFFFLVGFVFFFYCVQLTLQFDDDHWLLPREVESSCPRPEHI